MPWKTSTVSGARQRFVRAVLRREQSVAQTCREFGISRKTGFKWLRRFAELGYPGVHDRSRRPHHSPKRTPERWRKAIERLGLKHGSWGAKKLYARLRQEHPRARLPKTRTITKYLKGLAGRRTRPHRARPGPRLPRPNLTVPTAPNHVWTADFKGWFRTCDGQRVDPLTVRDLFSRFILGIRLLPHRHEPVRRYFQQLFQHYGQPRIIRVDHGSPFAGDGPLDLSRLSAWWLQLGIQVEFTGRARPQDNAAHEQMHRVYKAELTRPPAASPRAQQWRTTRWVYHYNHERPHEGLHQRVPASLYRKSPRPYRGPVRPVPYPPGWSVRCVTAHGFVRWKSRLRVIGRAFGGQHVGFKPLSPGVQEVYFLRQLIGCLVDTDPGGIRPAHWCRSEQAIPNS